MMMTNKITTIATIVPVEVNFFRGNGAAGLTVGVHFTEKKESDLCDTN